MAVDGGSLNMNVKQFRAQQIEWDFPDSEMAKALGTVRSTVLSWVARDCVPMYVARHIETLVVPQRVAPESWVQLMLDRGVNSGNDT